jgi:hypothetical protein
MFLFEIPRSYRKSIFYTVFIILITVSINYFRVKRSEQIKKDKEFLLLLFPIDDNDDKDDKLSKINNNTLYHNSIKNILLKIKPNLEISLDALEYITNDLDEITRYIVEKFPNNNNDNNEIYGTDIAKLLINILPIELQKIALAEGKNEVKRFKNNKCLLKLSPKLIKLNINKINNNIIINNEAIIYFTAILEYLLAEILGISLSTSLSIYLFIYLSNHHNLYLSITLSI